VGRSLLSFFTSLTRYYAVVIGTAYLALVILGVFTYERAFADGIGPGTILLLGLLMFLVTWRIAVLALLGPQAEAKANKLELGFLAVVLMLVAVQMSGGVDSPILPIFYLSAALMVYFLGVFFTLGLTLLGLATLTAQAFLAGDLAARWYDFSIVCGFSLVFVGTVGVFVRIPRDRAKKAQDTLMRLTTEAKRFSQERKAGLAVLSRDQLARADLNALLQVDNVLSELVDISKRALSAHTCIVALNGGESGSLVARAVSSNEQCPDEFFNEDLGDTVLREGLTGGRLRVDDLSAEPRQGRRHRTWGLKPRSLLMTQLVENNRTVGVLAIDSQYEAHFGRDEERFLNVMGRQVVAAIGRERLYRDVTAERAEFAAFYDLIKTLGSSIDLDTVSRVILESVQDIVAYDYGMLVMVDHDNQTGIVEAVAGLPAEKWLDAQFPLGESLIGWVIGSKTYLHFPNLRERSRGEERRRPVLSRDLPFKDVGSLLCLPLIQQNFVTGLLVFGAKRIAAFSPYEIKILEVLAVQAGVSLENARVHAQMELMATRDGLTGCFNHRYFQEWLEHELHRATRMPIPISLVFCDIDHFKKFNDTYGHPVGDQVLKVVAGVFRGGIRKNDLAARYGGEEFALVLLNSKKKDALRLAERVRGEVEKSGISFAGQKLNVTVSMGVATFPDDATEKTTLIDLADKALYAAKQSGRNRVCDAGELADAAK
jgi:diguanylate cyclase (GGDEF)-like protein